MTRVIAAALLLSLASAAQSGAAHDSLEGKQIFKNNRVTVNHWQIPPGESTPIHRHDHDSITVVVSGGQTQDSASPRRTNKSEAGDVRLRTAGVEHSTKNVGSAPFEAVTIGFADPQGKQTNIGKKSQTCAPDKESCVEEKELFCTEKVCVEDVVMAPQSMSVKHSHTTDHLLVAISDYELTDEVEGKGTVVRTHKAGELEYIPAGITHQLKNTGSAPAHFTVILWK